MRICIYRGSDSLNKVKALFREGEVDVMEEDAFGRTALHHALGARYPDDYWPEDRPINAELVRILMKQNPEAAKIKDKYGSLPLHFVTDKYSPPSSVLKLILDAHPKGARERDQHKLLPIHYACSRAASFHCVQMLYAVFRGSLKESDKDYNLPLHMACNANASYEVIKFLVEHFRASASMKGGKLERLPLHFSCLRKASFQVIRLLVDAYKPGVEEKDRDLSNPFHLACSNRASIETIMLLSNDFEFIVKERNYDRKLPPLGLNRVQGPERAGAVASDTGHLPLPN